MNAFEVECLSSGPAGWCSLLTISTASTSKRILIDCGSTCSELSRPAWISKLSDMLPSIDAVLISHSLLSHVGALPSVFARCPPSSWPLIYCTHAVSRFARFTLYEMCYSSGFCRFSKMLPIGDGENCSFHFKEEIVQTIHAIFDRCKRLRYNESCQISMLNVPHAFAPNSSETTVTVEAVPGGLTLGGSIWKISVSSGQTILFSSEFSLKPTTFFEPAAICKLTLRPTIFICGVRSSSKVVPSTNVQLFSAVASLVAPAHGEPKSVLIPVDPTVDAVDVLHELVSMWPPSLRIVPIYFVSPIASATMKFCNSHLEFMNHDVREAFCQTRELPLNRLTSASKFHIDSKGTCALLILCHSMEEYRERSSFLGDCPRVVVSSPATLNGGLSLQLFVEDFGPCSNSAVLFRTHPPEMTVASDIAAGGDAIEISDAEFILDVVPEQPSDSAVTTLTTEPAEASDALQVTSERDAPEHKFQLFKDAVISGVVEGDLESIDEWGEGLHEGVVILSKDGEELGMASPDATDWGDCTVVDEDADDGSDEPSFSAQSDAVQAMTPLMSQMIALKERLIGAPTRRKQRTLRQLDAEAVSKRAPMDDISTASSAKQKSFDLSSSLTQQKARKLSRKKHVPIRCCVRVLSMDVGSPNLFELRHIISSILNPQHVVILQRPLDDTSMALEAFIRTSWKLKDSSANVTVLTDKFPKHRIEFVLKTVDIGLSPMLWRELQEERLHAKQIGLRTGESAEVCYLRGLIVHSDVVNDPKMISFNDLPDPFGEASSILQEELTTTGRLVAFTELRLRTVAGELARMLPKSEVNLSSETGTVTIGSVSLRKDSAGTLVLHGPLCSEFYMARRVLEGHLMEL